MVGRSTIKDYLKDLKGKTIVLQEGGPHVGMLDDILRDAKLKWDAARPSASLKQKTGFR